MNKKLIAMFLISTNMLDISDIKAGESNVPPLSEEDRKQLNVLFGQINEIADAVSSSHCNENYPIFKKRYGKLLESIRPKFIKIEESYVFPRKDRFPYMQKFETSDECMYLVNGLENLLKQYTPVIERVYNALPADQKEEKEPPTDWKKEMQEVYDEQLETD